MNETQEKCLPENSEESLTTTTTSSSISCDKKNDDNEDNSTKASPTALEANDAFDKDVADKKIFSQLSDDTEVPIAALGVTQVTDVYNFMSDDENRVLMTLETPNKNSAGEPTITEQNGTLNEAAIATNQLEKIAEAKPTKVEATENQSSVKLSRDAGSTIKVLSNTVITPAKNSTNSESSLLKGMQNRMANVATGIEIPHELISTEMQSPPIVILNTQANKSTLQNQDLIAILEGVDDNEITDELKIAESYTQGNEDEDGDELLEQIQISIVGEDGVVKDISLLATSAPDTEVVEQRDTREIAMRQIMNLPRKHKRKMKLEEKHDLEDEPIFEPKTETSNEPDLSGNDLISSLVSDWSDNETKNEDPPAKNIVSPKHKQPSKVALALAKTVPIVPPKSIFSNSVEKLMKPRAKRPAPQKLVEPKINTSPIKIINKSVVPDPLPSFKRSRVIKKKIIWDPDAPETQVSYASLIGNTTVKKLTPVSAKATHTITRMTGTTMKTSTPKTVAATLAKIPATITVKSAVKSIEPETEKLTSNADPTSQKSTIEVIAKSPNILIPNEKKRLNNLKQRIKKEPKEKKETPKRKRTSVTTELPELSTVPPIASSPVAAKKKKLSEIDKLLGDEGAINMMYSLEKDNVELESMNTEDDKLGAKTRVIRNVVINKSISPNTTVRSRPKRDVTPVKHLLVEKQQDILLHKQLLQMEKLQTVTETSVKKSGAVRKKAATKKNDTWDYVYAQRNDDSMIIRRRSNSSYSSTTSPRRLSLDLSNQTSNDQGSSANVSMDEKPADNKFEFVKPTNKKMPMKNEDVKVNSALVSELKGKLTKVLKKKAAAAAVTAAEETIADNPEPSSSPARKSRSQSAATKIVVPPTTVMATLADKQKKNVTTTSLKEITVHHHENVVEVSIKASVKAKNCLTISMMQEISAILSTLTTSNRCKVVVLWAKSGTFGNGIDYMQLVQPSVEKRKMAAQELYATMSEFIKTLANFPKLIVFGCEGNSSGISVSLLPLFDVVYASESATFTISANANVMPECTYILTLFGNINKTCVNNMTYLGKSLDADTAKLNGIVTEVLKSSKFHAELLSEAQKISASVQTFGQLKAQQNKVLLPRLEQLLDEEQHILIQHWISHECQEQFKQLY